MSCPVRIWSHLFPRPTAPPTPSTATAVVFHHSFLFLFSLFFIFRFSYKINQYVLAFWANSMRIDHVQTIKHVPHSVYVIIYIYWAARPTTAATSLLLYWKSLDKTKSALVIFLPRDKSKYTRTHTTNTCAFLYANRNELRAYKIKTYDELLAGVHVYYTIHMNGVPVYFGLAGYNKNNKNILFGVNKANGTKGFTATTSVLYRASPILSVEE